jgi:hypothetical protein
MEREDTFFKRLQPLDDFAQLYEKSERFGTWNSKTLGIILVKTQKFLYIQSLCAHATLSEQLQFPRLSSFASASLGKLYFLRLAVKY